MCSLSLSLSLELGAIEEQSALSRGGFFFSRHRLIGALINSRTKARQRIASLVEDESLRVGKKPENGFARSALNCARYCKNCQMSDMSTQMVEGRIFEGRF